MFSTNIRLDLKNRIQKAIPLLPYVLLLLLLTKHAANSPNDQSRLATMESLVEQGTFAIDDSTFKDTVDKIFVNGHFYSGKPPVLSFLGAGFYFILHHVFRLSISDSLTYYSLTLLLVGVPSILMLVFFSKSLAFTRLDPKDHWIITYALGGGTLILSYSVVLNNHTVAASLLCLAFYCWLRIKQLPYNQSKFLFGAGFLSALAGVIDTAALPFVALFYILLVSRTRSFSLAYILGALAPFALHAVLNVAIVGDIFPAALFHSNLYHYPDSYWNNPIGIDALNEPKLVYTFHSLVGHHGLFLLTPTLIFPLVMLIKILTNRFHPFRREAIVVGFGCLVIIATYLFWSSNYGGVAFGFRWFILFVPLFFFFTAFFFVDVKSPRIRGLFYGLLYLSVVVAGIGVRNPWTVFEPYKMAKNLLGLA